MTRDPYYHVDRLDSENEDGFTRKQFDDEFKKDGYGPVSRDRWWKLLQQDKTIGPIRDEKGHYVLNKDYEALYARCL